MTEVQSDDLIGEGVSKALFSRLESYGRLLNYIEVLERCAQKINGFKLFGVAMPHPEPQATKYVAE